MHSPSESHSKKFLVVGAGPSGLATAACLLKNGIQIRIIEKSPGRTTESEALGVQAGRLECIDHFLDPKVTQRLIGNGFPARSASIHVEDRAAFDVNLSSIPSLYNC